MRLLPGLAVIGAYWDDINRIFTKVALDEEIQIIQDSLSNLPRFGSGYKRKLLTREDLEPSSNLVGLLFNIAHVMRSHGVSDEHVGYKETVKLLLTRYCDEREADGSTSKPLALQVYPDDDPEFMSIRLTRCCLATMQYVCSATYR